MDFRKSFARPSPFHGRMAARNGRFFGGAGGVDGISTGAGLAGSSRSTPPAITVGMASR